MWDIFKQCLILRIITEPVKKKNNIHTAHIQQVIWFEGGLDI